LYIVTQIYLPDLQLIQLPLINLFHFVLPDHSNKTYKIIQLQFISFPAAIAYKFY